MITDTLIFKQVNELHQPILVAAASRLMRRILQHITTDDQDYRQTGRVNIPGDGIFDAAAPRRDGDVVFNILAGSAYPINSRFW